MNLPHMPPAATTFSLISLAFAIASNVRTYRQDIRDDRKELRTLLQRLVAIPREKIDARVKYGDKSRPFVDFDRICNQENTMLSRQAAEIARRLKRKQESAFFKRRATTAQRRMTAKYVSATDFVSVGSALHAAYINEEALEFLQFAVDYAVSFNDEVAALRTMASIEFLRGNPTDGREWYRQAAKIFGKYPGFDRFTQVATNTQTQLSWAFSEAGANDLPAAFDHLKDAAAFVATLSQSPGAEGVKLQVMDAWQQFEQAPDPGPQRPSPPPVDAEIAHPRETQ